MKKISVLFLIISLLVSSGCSTMVHIETNVPGAVVQLDSENIGATPLDVSVSDGIWRSNAVTIQKDGYTTLRTTLKKEVKFFNVIWGMFALLPFLWAYGPASQQNFNLDKGSNAIQETGSSK